MGPYPWGMARFVVRVERGGPWEWSLDMRKQAGWDDHAAFMDRLVDEGFILLAGPLEGGRDVLWIVEAESGWRYPRADDRRPLGSNGMLRPIRIERWTVVLDGLTSPDRK